MNFNGARTFNFRWLRSVCVAIVCFYFCTVSGVKENGFKIGTSTFKAIFELLG